MSELKSLKGHNTMRTEMHLRRKETMKKTGIACPECGKELYDSQADPDTSIFPPRVRVECSDERRCGWQGYRVA